MANYYLGPQPKAYFVDLDGAPLANGFVYTYAAGTSTPLATYQSYSGSANTNPIQLDSSGMANIWYQPDLLYKILVTDSLGTPLYTEDNYPGSMSGGSSSSSWPGTQTAADSNTLVDLGAVGSNNVLITGTTTINSFGSSATLANPWYALAFNGVLSITNSSNLLVRSGVSTIGDNLTTASGDTALAAYFGSGAWKIFAYFRNDASINASSITCNTLTVTTTANLP